MATAIFGEATVDEVIRDRHLTTANYDYNLLRVNPHHIELGIRVPTVADVGIGVKSPFSPNPWQTVRENNIGWAFDSVPSTTKLLKPIAINPINLPDVMAWQTHTVDPMATSSNVTTDVLDNVTKDIFPKKTFKQALLKNVNPLPAHPNKFSLLETD